MAANDLTCVQIHDLNVYLTVRCIPMHILKLMTSTTGNEVCNRQLKKILELIKQKRKMQFTYKTIMLCYEQSHYDKN